MQTMLSDLSSEKTPTMAFERKLITFDDEKNTPHVCGNIIHIKIERLKRPWQTSVEIATVYSRALHTTIAAV